MGKHARPGRLRRLLGRRRAVAGSGEPAVPAPPSPDVVADLQRQLDELRTENAQLRQAMLIDPRTGLANAAAFDADHAQLDARRRRSNDPYSILLADIDLFQAIVDERGGEAGLATIEAVAGSIAETVRGTDRTYRLGDEEFAVLLPGAELREAVAAAERVRRRVERLAIPHPAGPAGVVSVTIAAISAGFRHASPKEVLVELEGLLLEGKKAGRNRVVWPH